MFLNASKIINNYKQLFTLLRVTREAIIVVYHRLDTRGRKNSHEKITRAPRQKGLIEGNTQSKASAIQPDCFFVATSMLTPPFRCPIQWVGPTREYKHLCCLWTMVYVSLIITPGRVHAIRVIRLFFVRPTYSIIVHAYMLLSFILVPAPFPSLACYKHALLRLHISLVARRSSPMNYGPNNPHGHLRRETGITSNRTREYTLRCLIVWYTTTLSTPTTTRGGRLVSL